MNKLLTFFIALTFLFSAGTTIAQRAQMDTLIKKFDQYRTHNFQEKIYLSTDQSTYLTGETIWFSVYTVDATFHKPTDVSAVAYVEIVDRTNQSVAQAKMELTNGRGSGSLYLSPSINSGNFVIRAYTNWMKNYPAEFYFHKNISIVNPFTPLDPPPATTTTSGHDAQFFPEGGNLLAGVDNKIGFRVVDRTGQGISFKGAVVNSDRDTIVHFTPMVFGIGSFDLKPTSGTTYKAVIKDDNGKIQEIDLPEVKTSGYTLKVVDSPSQFIIHAQSTGEITLNLPVYIFVHARNQITHVEYAPSLNAGFQFKIDKQTLAEGISHITLFDASLNPVSERLVFRQPTKRLKVTTATDQREYGVRRPVILQLQTSNSTGAAQSATLSVSVYKTDSITSPFSSGNILDYLWLSSDLKGTIESPTYYLDTKNPELNKALDNLMLTHGWRRFSWNNVLSPKPQTVKFIPETSGHVVTGDVFSEDNTPASGLLTYVSSPGKKPLVYLSRSDNNGQVQFIMRDFYGPRKLVAELNYASDSTHHVKIRNPFSDAFAKNDLKPVMLSSEVKEQLLNRSIAMQVSDVYYREKLEQFIKPTVDTIPFYGKADEHFNLDDYTRFPVMEEVMREYVPGVLVRKRKDGFHFLVLDDVKKSVFSETPLILLDGVPLFDADEIMAFDPLKVKSLDVMRRTYYLGAQGFPGVVSYGTYTGDLNGFNLSRHSVVLEYEGLQLQREFYTPRYDNQKQRETRMPDQRYLLHWNPSVATDAQGKAHATFYTSDVPGKYKVVVEGLDKNGEAGTQTTSFEVKAFNN